MPDPYVMNDSFGTTVLFGMLVVGTVWWLISLSRGRG